MTHSLGEAWALDDDHRGRVGDRTAHGFCTDLVGLHVPHASEAILGCEPTELCLPSRICCGSYPATEIQLYSALPPPGARLGFAPDLGQLPNGKVESTPLSWQQLLDSGLGFGIPESEEEKVGVDWIREHAAERDR